jgi:NAD(P)-dependent dehydrogenase (short-subunit alcohol dehydrogenase family)
MENKTILISGATNGIGWITARELARGGATTILVGRNLERTRSAVNDIRQVTGNPNVDYLVADLSSQKQIHTLAKTFQQRYNRLDVLVNNAGAIFNSFELSEDGIERTFALNHLGYFLLTHLLLETLQQSQPARIVNVSSMAHIGGRLNLNNLQLKGNFSSWGAYSQSKLANLYFTYELARRLEGSRVTVNALHPGFVNTNFGKSNGGMKKVMMGALQSVFAITPEKGAETSIYLASSPEVEGVSGQYFVNNNAVRSSQISYDQEIARQLWDASLEMTGLNVTV